MLFMYVEGQKLRILLFGSMGNLQDVIAGYLSQRGHDVVCVPFPQNVLHDEPGYRRELLRAVKQYSPQVVMPVGCSLALARIKEELCSRFNGICVAVGDAKKIELLDSKVALYEYAFSLGIPQPVRYMDLRDIPSGARVVFKKDVSYGGQGVRMPGSFVALEHLVEHAGRGAKYLLEEFVDGDNYSVDAVRFPDGSGRMSSYKCLAGHGTGPAIEREIVSYSLMSELARKILDSLDYVGLCGFDFIVDRDNRPYLLEANPRFTGGVQTQISSGFHIPDMLLDAFQSEQ